MCHMKASLKTAIPTQRMRLGLATLRKRNWASVKVEQVLRRELAHIPVSLRVPLELRYFENMGLEDIAQALNLTLSATKSRLHRAHACLRRRMVRHCGSRGIGTLTRVA